MTDSDIDAAAVKRKKLFVGYFFVAMIFLVLITSAFGKFVPTQAGTSMGLFVAILCSAAGPVLASLPVKNPSTGFWRRSKIIRSVMAAIPFFWMGWQNTVQGVLPVVTWIIGEPGTQHETISGWHDARVMRCLGPDFVGFVLPSPVCASRDMEVEFPKGSDVTLRGRRSTFGISVETFS